MLIECTIERRIDDEGHPIGRWAVKEPSGVVLVTNGVITHREHHSGEFSLPHGVEVQLGVSGVRITKIPTLRLHKMTYCESVAVFTMVVNERIIGRSFFLPLNHSDVLAFIIESAKPIDLLADSTPGELERLYKSIL